MYRVHNKDGLMMLNSGKRMPFGAIVRPEMFSPERWEMLLKNGAVIEVSPPEPPAKPPAKEES